MSGPPRRLPSGGRIDRRQPLAFRFDGRALEGFAGDTLASALLAAGVKVVGSSFKYGRARGVVGAGAEEPNAIVGVGEGDARVPNLRATEVPLYEGLVASSNRPGFRKRGFGALARLLPTGFYYKTFMAPAPLWPFAERMLRDQAGLGRVPEGRDPVRYDKANHHCDVLVAGGGPSGLAAALEATRAGARVVLADEQAEFGGSLLGAPQRIDGQAGDSWVAVALQVLERQGEATLLPRCTVFGYHDHDFLTALERLVDRPGRADARQRLHRIRAKQTVLATGATERPLAFAGNDLPGVMLASAVSAYVNRYAVAPGERLVLATTGDGAYRCALDWQRAGRQVAAVLDARPAPSGALPEQARAAGIPVWPGYAPMEARGGAGGVRCVLAAPLNVEGTGLAGPPRRIACDLVASSGGWNPAIHLASQAGAKAVWREELVAFVAEGPRQNCRSAGAANGAFDLQACLDEGAAAGAAAAAAAGFGDGRPATAYRAAAEPPEEPQRALFLVPHRRPASRAPKQFVDQQLDVTAADIELAAREGYRAVEHVKRYTALGFGTDQGKLGNVNGIAVLAQTLGRSMAETGTTVFRPAYTPVAFGAVAGRDVGDLFDPERRTPMHDWHVRHGAAWENVGRWRRPWYYPRGGEAMADAVRRECLAVRQRVGLLDASTLGKIDIQGQDAAEFLDRIYTGGFRRLGIGRCRYGLMLREDGTIFDDGVTARLAERRYLMHTTTGNAEAVLAWLELWRQTEWPQLDVHCVSVTDHWATAALAGPRARAVLAELAPDFAIDNAAFAFMQVREGRVAGLPARVFRISFSGEISFEINVPAEHGEALWSALMAAGERFGIAPYGTETMHVLRAEKGYILVGQDTDGSMTPEDMGLGWAVRAGKPFGFVGDRSLALADHRRPDRLQFVGLAATDAATVLPEGTQLLDSPAEPPAPMAGHVTSSYYSPILARPVALGLVKGGRARQGQTVHAALADGRMAAARIVDPVFYDPKGERQRG